MDAVHHSSFDLATTRTIISPPVNGTPFRLSAFSRRALDGHA
jgi:hypothetical protein